MKRYKLIYFVPDPFNQGRIPVGALVEDNNHARAVVASHLPGAECLGSHKNAALMRMILRDLNLVNKFELPAFISPHVRLDSEHIIPLQIEDPFAWVHKHILPHKPHSDEAQKPPLTDHITRRATIGFQFFRNWRVDHYVNQTFKPGRDWNSWLKGSEDILQPISHWVASDEQILLMEPIIPEDAHHKFDDELKKVAQRFLSYRGFFEKNKPGASREGHLVAYILPGIDRELRVKAFAKLDRASDEVVDFSAEKERTRFFERVKSLGEKGPKHTLLS